MSNPSMNLMGILWPAGLAVQAVSVASELRLAELVADGPKTAAELAIATGTDELSLGKLLRALTSLGVFEHTAGGAFAQTAMSDTLRPDHPQSMCAWARMLAADFVTRSSGALATTIRTGTPGFEHVFGSPFFTYLQTHPKDAASYDSAMGSLSSHVDSIVAAYDFSSCNRVVDVGGGRGGLLQTILSAYPHLTGVLYDRADVVKGVAGSDRLSVVAGDFFEMVPSGGDTYILSRVLHDWDDAATATILKNSRRAVSAQGRLLIIDAVTTPEDDPSRAFMDLLMLSLTGGHERSVDEFRRLLVNAGFRLMQVLRTDTAAVLESIPV